MRRYELATIQIPGNPQRSAGGSTVRAGFLVKEASVGDDSERRISTSPLWEEELFGDGPHHVAVRWVGLNEEVVAGELADVKTLRRVSAPRLELAPRYRCVARGAEDRHSALQLALLRREETVSPCRSR
jgi:hypothetical protein